MDFDVRTERGLQDADSHVDICLALTYFLIQQLPAHVDICQHMSWLMCLHLVSVCVSMGAFGGVGRGLVFLCLV